MLFFEENIFYPINHKQDHIKLSDTKIIHYKISSDRQNQRWFIAVTLEDNGEVTPQKQLSKQFSAYGQIISYVHILPSIVLQRKSEGTVDYKMREEFNKIISSFEITLGMLESFKEKYNI